ncbi:hypothetical protein GGR55DRAFT_442188 [Xylaria sp. FL0064]|nr:hypothetical protein GGR55DRAFT_442188 [Xylaria sp. FL0064]
MELAEMHDSSSKLVKLASELSQRLNGLTGPNFDGASINTLSLDSRLELLKPYPIIETQAKVAMRERSIKHLEAKSELLVQALETADNDVDRTEQGLEAILSLYQKTILFLLDQEEYPGLSPQELEKFKLHFRTSLRRLACPVAECQFPPFFSHKTLQNHTRVHHNNVTGGKPIRRDRTRPKPGDPSLFGRQSSPTIVPKATGGFDSSPPLADNSLIDPAVSIAAANPSPMNASQDLLAVPPNTRPVGQPFLSNQQHVWPSAEQSSPRPESPLSKLDRTTSDIYQDELPNPNLTSTSASQAPQTPPTGSLKMHQQPPNQPLQGQPSIRLLRPENMRTIQYFDAVERQRYEEGLQVLWAKVERNPPESKEHQIAKHHVSAFSHMVMNKIKTRHALNLANAQGQANLAGPQQQSS